MAVTGQQIISVRNGKMRVSVLRVPADKPSDPISKFLHRLCAPLRWWSRSTPQIAVHELGRTILRIPSIPKAISALREGLVASPHIPDAYKVNHRLVSMLPLACKTGMEKLEKAHQIGRESRRER